MPVTSHKAKRGQRGNKDPENYRIITIKPKGKAKRPDGNPDIAKHQAKAIISRELNSSIGMTGLNKQLSEIIRAIGHEQVDPDLGWTRVAAVVRRMYTEAMGGKVDAAKLLFERGWGLMPKPVQLSVRAEIVQKVQEAGLTLAQAWQDPLLRELMESNGLRIDEQGLPQLIIDGQIVEPPKETT